MFGGASALMCKLVCPKRSQLLIQRLSPSFLTSSCIFGGGATLTCYLASKAAHQHLGQTDLHWLKPIKGKRKSSSQLCSYISTHGHRARFSLERRLPFIKEGRSGGPPQCVKQIVSIMCFYNLNETYCIKHNLPLTLRTTLLHCNALSAYVLWGVWGRVVWVGMCLYLNA